jgi:arylsulfatase A-like enzyme
MNFLEPQRKFLENCSNPLPARRQEQPFCLCVTFNLPHSCGAGNMEMRPTDDDLYITRYRERFDAVPLPETYMSWEEAPPRIPREVYNGVYIPSYNYVREPHSLRERRIRVYQNISGIDRFLGNMRAKLENLGLAGNTIIVFSTDHGIHHGEHGLGGKCFLYEEDIRIPMIVYDPRRKEKDVPHTREEMVAVPDLAPTIYGTVRF